MQGYTYPVRFAAEPEDGGRIHAYARDLPGAVASGGDLAAARDEARLALAAAAAHLLAVGESLPLPSAIERGEEVVALPAALAAKAAVVAAFREAGITKTALADRLGLAETEARRILDPSHATRLDRLDAAARALGASLVIGLGKR